MNIFLAALHFFVPHFRVRGHILLLSQGHPFNRVAIDLHDIGAHKMPGPATLRLRKLRGPWVSFSMQGFRPAEVSELRALLRHWEALNHQRGTRHDDAHSAQETR